ncbi:MAG: ATP-binding cassette domain-containing protein, partial [Gemmatimonadetes bacterium]|nr:ATP-binding cassette domain-containing protein [Gemmatimonadota bacterium]
MSDSPILKITGLQAKVAEEDLDILRGVDLEIRPGEIHAIMGPNGSGKSTLAKVLMGHPGYEVTGGEVLYQGEPLLELEPDERARAGLFLAFQYPVDIPGVSIANFLRAAKQARMPEGEDLDLFDFQDDMIARMELLEMDQSFAERSVNDGFSGGEKKRNEIL